MVFNWLPAGLGDAAFWGKAKTVKVPQQGRLFRGRGPAERRDSFASRTDFSPRRTFFRQH